MKRSPVTLAFSLFIFCLLTAAPPKSIAGEDWKPIDPAQLALKAPLVEKDADAEALFWEVKIDDNPQGDLIFNHYIRIKVFTERGRESQSKIDIPFGKLSGREIKIQDIAARTLKADGSILELKKEDVFERTVVKTNGLKLKVKSFAIPGIEPGCIIEYRWREVRVNRSANYVRLEFQRDVPVQNVKYLIKPYPFEGFAMRSITLHGKATPFVKEKEGFYSTSMTNVPAVHEESRMPPEDQVKAWMLIYYSKDTELNPDKYWFDYGKRVYEGTKSLLKVNDEVRQAATTIIGDATTPEAKLARLFDFCRDKIKNVADDASGITAEERKKLKENKSPADTLKRGVGNGADIDLLFAALATAAGYDARIVLAPDRGDLFFDKAIANSYFLDPSNIAVRVGEGWKFYNPGSRYIPIGMLRWQEEGLPALITDPKEPVWVSTPLSVATKSTVKRTGKLKLSEDGTLEGDVELEFSGHPAMERKEENDDDSQTQREETLKDEIKARLSTAEISNIKIENVTDPVKPFVYSFHLRVPGYAQKTGKRLFLQPAVFQRGIGALFSASERKYDIYFHYPWQEVDHVMIELPAGYALDNADAPAPFSGGEISNYKPTLSVTKDQHTLIYKREFFFGGGGNILFPVSTYPQLKRYFDEIHKQDNHTVSLKQGAATASN
jgi:transglutaminase-like putative cysteine protease